MQDTIIDVQRRTQELTIFEIVSLEIDPVLFILLLTTEQFPSNGLMVNCQCLTQLITSSWIPVGVSESAVEPWPVAAAYPAACLESLPILLSDLVRVHPGRPAALPTATAWDEELRARTAGVRLTRPGHSESSFRTDLSVCPIMLRHRYQ